MWTMKWREAVLLLLAVLLVGCARPLVRPYYPRLSTEALDCEIRRVASSGWSNQQKMVYYSERFMGAPYELYCEGDGPYARYDTRPLLNLKKLNCMTYCEIVLALTLADYYEDFFNILQHIRYRQGIMGMASRNHYTMADWLPANSWCLEDVTQRVGGSDAVPLTRTISHQRFFAGKGFVDLPVVIPEREVTISYIPLARLAAHKDSLRSGDIVALIQDRPGIFSAHMLLVIRNERGLFFRHASMSAGKVVDTPFVDYLASLMRNPRYLGMSFMRVREEVRWHDGPYTHGRFMLNTQ
ncbi:MAG: DUF1460 domain-containing protein [bacterium]|jgi:hypothetical protein|nr:DUF1460 domain-containing protein [candidate division KSB1 bacterium]MDH7560377.1 DUF1460 domain-containing protein [bacterium]